MQMNEPLKIKVSDQEVADWLRKARVPMRYRSKTATLRDSAEARAFLIWLDNMKKQGQHSYVGCVIGDSADSIEGFGLHMRSLVVSGFNLLRVSLPELVDMHQTAWLESHIREVQCLAINGFHLSSYVDGLSSAQRQSVDLFLRDWVENDRSLLLETDSPVQDCVVWSKGLRSLLVKNLAFVSYYKK